MPLPLSLEGRLLCASQQAYLISGETFLPEPGPPPTPSSLVGWLETPRCFATGDERTNAVLVGETAGEIIIAFRGTTPFSDSDREKVLVDWVNDAICQLTQAPNVPGSVHAAFSHECNELWSWVTGAVLGYLSPKPLWVTGHSKGGALANIAAAKFAAAGRVPNVCTFEAARCGDQKFADGFAELVPHAERYEFHNDVVPFLPPKDDLATALKELPLLVAALNTLIASYVPVGMLKYVNLQNQIVGDSAGLDQQRIASVIAKIEALGCISLVDDHSIAPGSGAAGAICGPIWPAAPPPQAAARPPG
jgi:hypothetical protein